ncbi:hypothetical protein D9M68_430820 [compost metagenome]
MESVSKSLKTNSRCGRGRAVALVAFPPEKGTRQPLAMPPRRCFPRGDAGEAERVHVGALIEARDDRLGVWVGVRNGVKR